MFCIWVRGYLGGTHGDYYFSGEPEPLWCTRTTLIWASLASRGKMLRLSTFKKMPTLCTKSTSVDTHVRLDTRSGAPFDLGMQGNNKYVFARFWPTGFHPCKQKLNCCKQPGTWEHVLPAKCQGRLYKGTRPALEALRQQDKSTNQHR